MTTCISKFGVELLRTVPLCCTAVCDYINSEINQIHEKNRLCDTFLAWEQIKLGYLAKIAELNKRGFNISTSYYD